MRVRAAGTTGQDPNDLINLQVLRDRRIDRTCSPPQGPSEFRNRRQLATNLALVSGQPYGSQVQVSLPQDRRAIYIEALGSFCLSGCFN